MKKYLVHFRKNKYANLVYTVSAQDIVQAVQLAQDNMPEGCTEVRSVSVKVEVREYTFIKELPITFLEKVTDTFSVGTTAYQLMYSPEKIIGVYLLPLDESIETGSIELKDYVLKESYLVLSEARLEGYELAVKYLIPSTKDKRN